MYSATVRDNMKHTGQEDKTETQNRNKHLKWLTSTHNGHITWIRSFFLEVAFSGMLPNAMPVLLQLRCHTEYSLPPIITLTLSHVIIHWIEMCRNKIRMNYLCNLRDATCIIILRIFNSTSKTCIVKFKQKYLFMMPSWVTKPSNKCCAIINFLCFTCNKWIWHNNIKCNFMGFKKSSPAAWQAPYMRSTSTFKCPTEP